MHDKKPFNTAPIGSKENLGRFAPTIRILHVQVNSYLYNHFFFFLPINFNFFINQVTAATSQISIVQWDFPLFNVEFFIVAKTRCAEERRWRVSRILSHNFWFHLQLTNFKLLRSMSRLAVQMENNNTLMSSFDEELSMYISVTSIATQSTHLTIDQSWLSFLFVEQKSLPH